jgi:hypothetical protein
MFVLLVLDATVSQGCAIYVDDSTGSCLRGVRPRHGGWCAGIDHGVRHQEIRTILGCCSSSRNTCSRRGLVI